MENLEARPPVAERFYALYCEQFSPDLTVPGSVVEEWIAWERPEQRKSPSSPQQVVDWTFAERVRF